MNILFIHNFYQIPGGEDAVFKNEIALLEYGMDRAGYRAHTVSQYTIHNDEVTSVWAKVVTALFLPFSIFQYRKLKQYLLITQPDVVHVHNYFPLYSPSIFYACKSAGIPVVHTLHNYRAVCPTTLLMHEGKIEERSIKGASWWTVAKKVYRGSFVGSLTLAAMVELHKWLGTWQTKVDCFIALTEFSKQKYVEAGWPEHKICVKPNFIEEPFNGEINFDKEDCYALFVGRLSEEKGVDTLINAWTNNDFPLKIIGDGPLKEYVESESLGAIEFIGCKNKSDVLTLMQGAEFIIMPSTCYETFGMVIIEAFSCAKPVICSRLGSLKVIVEDGMTGLHFEAGNAQDLAEKAQWLIDNPECAREMGQNARNEYLAKYTPEKNYKMLMNIYQQAIDESKYTHE